MATLGLLTEGANSDSWGDNWMPVWGPYTMPSDGTLDSLTMIGAVSTGSCVIKGVVYNDNGSNAPGTLFAYFAHYTLTLNSNDPVTISTAITYNAGTTLVNGNKYHLGFLVAVGNRN